MNLETHDPTNHYSARNQHSLRRAPGAPDGRPDTAAGDTKHLQQRPPVDGRQRRHLQRRRQADFDS
jgi:hypothetical protein